MYEAIKNFAEQFAYQPEIRNAERFSPKSGFIVVGMGGSALAAKLLQDWRPDLDVLVRTDYGLPEMDMDQLERKLIILSSYSGNTEEVIEAFNIAKEKNLALAVITTGGKLLELAIENQAPYVQMPQTGIEPRAALGFSLKAFLKLMGEEEELKKLDGLATSLNAAKSEGEGKMLAQKLQGRVPVIYASSRNEALSYIWKINFNETGKTPAFCNTFPELNHNEMNAFSAKGGSASGGDVSENLSSKFYFLFLQDEADDPKILKRMAVLQKLYTARHLPVEVLELKGDFWPKIFSSVILAAWTAYHTALLYNLDPDQVPLVEEFKKLIKG